MLSSLGNVFGQGRTASLRLFALERLCAARAQGGIKMEWLHLHLQDLLTVGLHLMCKTVRESSLVQKEWL